ncbi:hypothetical protein [Haladaptatus sp. CMAA 1911]|uniref:hypothetical protein n=1 Tax=unclassified Haladaptatus TaxID=2622732 RepID=UPI0037545CE3
MTNVRVPPEAMRAAGAAEGRSVVVGKTTVGGGHREPTAMGRLGRAEAWPLGERPSGWWGATSSSFSHTRNG